MAVHTYLFDFTIEPKALETVEGRRSVKDNVESCLKEYISNLKCESYMELDGGFLAVLIERNGGFGTIRGVKQGIITINIEFYRPEGGKELLSSEMIKKLIDTFRTKTRTEKIHVLPPIKRSNLDIYFPTSDERLLEYDIDKIIFEGRSPYQKIQVLHSKTLGNFLVLDDLQNMSESDLIYTETLMQRGIENYKNKEIIILGGGDGCLLWELLKENPKFVTMLELDEMVMKVCSKHLRSSCGNCLDKYKGEHYEIIVGDCFKTLDNFIKQGKKFDYVFGDLTDAPVDSTKQHNEVLNFIKLIINKSLQVLKPGGKYMTHCNGAAATESLRVYEDLLSSLKFPVTFTRAQAYIPSFMEQWVFYQVTSCPGQNN